MKVFQKISPFYRTIALYGLLLAALAFAMHLLHFKHLVYDITTEVYVTLVGSILLVLGIWLGNRLTSGKKEEVVVTKLVESSADLALTSPDEWGISKREMEVLQLMADGLSNQKIADTLFISLSTVKTHSSNLYSKLGVTNRVQAVKMAKEQRLIA